MSPEQVLADPGYAALKADILELTGLHYYADKDRDLAAHLSKRLLALSIASCTAYRPLLAGGESEFLVSELTIGETYFLRQPEHFALLRNTIIPELIHSNALSQRLKIWSAGCATGAEPYSLAILLSLDFESALAGWSVSVLGTDINTEYLRQARSGIFSKWALREVPEALRARCFEPQGVNWRLRDEYRRIVTFERHNLIHGPAPAVDFDLILCRNVLIYFSRTRIEQVAARLHAALKPGGWLLVGHAEPSSSIFHEYELVQAPGVTAYRRRAQPVPPAITPEEWKPPVLAAEAEPVPERTPSAFAPPSPPPAVEPDESLDQIRRLADRGDWAQAEVTCRRYISANPVDAVAYLTLGLILEHRECPPDALEAFRRTIYLDRGMAIAHFHLAQCYAAGGHRERAIKALDNVIQLLASRPDGQPVAHADGMSVHELRQLATLQLERLRAR